MDKLQFEFTVLPATDGKTNVWSITTITTADNKTYGIPPELQPAALHTELIKQPAFNKVKNSIRKRYQYRKVWITLTEDLKSTYIDDGNLQFCDQYLELLGPDAKTTAAATPENTNTLHKILEKLMEREVQVSGNQNIKKIADKFILEKFTSKNNNANQWIEFFEKECVRFDITTDEKKIEILRFFMDKSCMDWYSSMIIKLSLDSEWSTWKTKFCESFANKGWSPVTYALLFKYKDGSLLDYAIKKEKLLLDMRRSIDAGTLVDLVAAGMPEFVLSKLDRETIKDTIDLFNEISKYEHMTRKNNNGWAKKTNLNLKTDNKLNEKKPCSICARSGKGVRYHPETACYFKDKNDVTKIHGIRHVNNSEIEVELNENEQKNE